MATKDKNQKGAKGASKGGAKGGKAGTPKNSKASAGGRNVERKQLLPTEHAGLELPVPAPRLIKIIASRRLWLI